MKRGIDLLKADLRVWWKWVLLAVALWAVSSLTLGTPCWFVWGLGIPCPFCGLTRAGFLLLQGRFAESFAFQPMLLPILVCIALLAASRYGSKKLFPVAIVCCILCFCACIVFYIWKMTTVFPDTPPYVYRENHLFRFLWDSSR